MKSGIMKRIETLESQMESTESNQWNYCNIISGEIRLAYVKHIITGQRVYDEGFIAEILHQDRLQARIKPIPIHVQIGPDDESSDAIREAIERGIISPKVQHAANFNEPDDALLGAEIIAIDKNSSQ